MLAATLLLASTIQPTRADGDPAKGENVFKRCAACHTATTQNRVGPGLAGIFGQPAASVAGYKYSPALAASGLAWDEATLDRFLEAPAKLVPGTRMTMPLPKADDRHDVIAYLKALASPSAAP
ncbi:MAG TPA: cytochrome c family protein [Geminicoccus sp.]|uniref:c-type cytochrome n=1 Tax=Geminicoccus sp. TaxID=2024832 RepID=UPI002BFC9AE6|nr:cytochrome c family protein [Geminicoccus sp.]HWL71960.1 cytochrome c family protein [Geminicoccus sp.]